jgi:hypothetical protein
LVSVYDRRGAAAQHAAGQADAPQALARLATAHGLPCTAADWSFFARSCLDATHSADEESGTAQAAIWQLVQDPAQGTGIPPSAITRVIGIITQPEGGPPVVGHVVGDLAPRAPASRVPYPSSS